MFESFIKFGRLKQTNPKLNIRRTQILRALYRGGHSLLDDMTIMREVFPKYAHESPAVYEERCRRAFYENIFALVVNQVAAGLAQDPIRFEPEVEEEDKDLDLGDKPDVVDDVDPDPDDDGDDDTSVDPAKNPDVKEDIELAKTDPKMKAALALAKKKAPKVDQYWMDLLENATALADDGSTQRSLDQVLRDCAVEALVTGWSWLQTELPPAADPNDPFAPKSLKEQEDQGKLRAYLVPWPTDKVTDWEEVKGRLLWVRTYECRVEAATPGTSRDDVTHCWTVWDDTGWATYEFVQEKDKSLPQDDAAISMKNSGTHSFGRVPWVRLNFDSIEGTHLHIGDIIESLCRNYFNRQNGESFQWVQYFFQQLYEFLGPEVAGIDTVVSDAQQDPARAQRKRAPGMVHVRGADDRAEFVGPDMGGASAGREALIDIRDGILRITSQMALAQDTSGAMLRRSADSKRQDSVSTEIVVGAIGKRVLIFGLHAVKLLASGRKDAEVPQVLGYSRFSIEDTQSIIDQFAALSTTKIPSARFQIEAAYQAALSYLGDNATPEMKHEIRMQLESALTQDQMMNMMQPPTPPELDLGDEDPDAEEDEDPDAEEDDDKEVPPKKANPFDKSKKDSPGKFGKKTNPAAKKPNPFAKKD